MKYKKYILFQILEDVIGSFDTVEEAKQRMDIDDHTEYEIVNRDTLEVVEVK